MLDKKYDRSEIPDFYLSGKSPNEFSRLTGFHYSEVRKDILSAGVEILSRKEGVARHPGGWNRNRIGIPRYITPEWRENMSKSALARGDSQGRAGVGLGDKQNNAEDNLTLVTKSGHGRLHRLQDRLAGISGIKGSKGLRASITSLVSESQERQG